MRAILFYKTSSEKSPIEEFPDTLSWKQSQKVVWVLKLVGDLENVPAQYFKKMVNTDDLWEVRVVAGANTFRFLGFFDGKHLVVLAHAFQKKTQKTPSRAIKTAENRKRYYFLRKKNE